MNTVAIRASILHFVADPYTEQEQAYEYWEDGILWVENGYVKVVGATETLVKQLPNSLDLQHYPDALLIPGFVDTHIHYPQTEMIAAYGKQLLDWLNTYTFQVEQKFADKNYAKQVASFFLQELIRQGTTTALVFGTVHPESVDAFFEEVQELGLRMIAGKVLMDRNSPEALQDTVESAYQDSKVLIERWHGVDRLQYAVTPRFAPTSTPEQLQVAGQLLQEYPDVYMHTHLSENQDEVCWVAELFPEADNYLDVYQRAGLMGKRSVFAHGIHLSDQECECLAKHDAAIAHCPSSNQFLGSGLINLPKLQQHQIKVGLGTDVGGGSSFSILKTMASAYEVQQLNGHSLDPFQNLYLATLGGAKALDLDDKIGNFVIGKEADFLVLNPKATPLLAFRNQHCKNLFERLFMLQMLGDDRCVQQVYSMGQQLKSS